VQFDLTGYLRIGISFPHPIAHVLLTGELSERFLSTFEGWLSRRQEVVRYPECQTSGGCRTSNRVHLHVPSMARQAQWGQPVQMTNCMRSTFSLGSTSGHAVVPLHSSLLFTPHFYR